MSEKSARSISVATIVGWLAVVALVDVQIVRIISSADGNVGAMWRGAAITLGVSAVLALALYLGLSGLNAPAKKRALYVKDQYPDALVWTCWRNSDFVQALSVVTKGEKGADSVPTYFTASATEDGLIFWAGDAAPYTQLARVTWDEFERPKAGRTTAFGRVVPAIILPFRAERAKASIPLVMANERLAGMLPLGSAAVAGAVKAVTSLWIAAPPSGRG